MIAAVVLSFAQVTLGLLIWFVAVPLWQWPRRGRSTLEKIFYSFTISVCVWLGLGYLLAMTSSVELATLLLLLAGLIAAHSYRSWRKDLRGGRQQERRERRTERTARLLDAMDPDSQHSFVAVVRQDAHSALAAGKLALKRYLQPYNVLSAVAVAAILAQGIASVGGQYAPATPDGFTELLAAKTLTLNMGAYSLGTYPMGLPLMTAILSTVFFSDPMQILRFFGPWTALLVPLAAALCALAVADSGWASLAALVLTGLTFAPALGGGTGDVWVPLTLHLAAAFILLSVAFSVRFLRRQEMPDAWAAAAAAFASVLCQPLVAPLTILLPLLLMLPSARRINRPWLVPALVSTASLFGLVPVLAGVAAGHPWLSALLIPLAATVAQVPAWLTGPSAIAFLGAAGLLSGLSALRMRSLPASDAGLFGGIALILLVLAVIAALPLPAPFSAVVHLGNVVGYVALPLLLGWIFALVADRSPYPRAAAGLAGLILVGTLAGAARPGQVLLADQLPGAAQVVTRIAGTFPAYSWTVVSPVQQYSEVLGKGWHVELITFLHKVPLADAGDAAFRLDLWTPLRIETPDIFMFVPLQDEGGARPRPSDAHLPLPATSSSAYAGRAGLIVDAHAAEWARLFLQSHPHAARVFFRNRDLLVIWIHQ